MSFNKFSGILVGVWLAIPSVASGAQAFETETHLVVNLPTHSLTIALPEEFKRSSSYRLIVYPQPGLYSPSLMTGSDPEMLMRWASSLFQKGQIQEAMQYLLEAERLDRTNPQVKNMLGSLAYKLERFEEAVNYWKQSLSLNPNQSKVKQFLKKVQDMLKVKKSKEKAKEEVVE